MTLIATDLDRTLIYSASTIDEWGGPDDLVCVETYRGADASFMTAAAAETLTGLGRVATIVPVTTRTAAQLDRVRLPGPPARWAVAANGGVLLVDGVPDPAWRRHVEACLASVATLDEVRDLVAAACRPEFTSAIRDADGLFCYAVVARAALPEDFVAEQRDTAARSGWTVSVQGRKVYWVPDWLTKSAAVAEVVRRTGAGTVLAAGDSLLDADLLVAADHGIVARHGELLASGWPAPPHVSPTRACGIRAGDEIVRWFGARLDRLAEKPDNDQVSLIT